MRYIATRERVELDEQKKQVEELMKANQQSTDTQSNTTQSEQKATQNKGTGATKPW